LVLMLEPQGREEALRLLFNVKSPWGRRNWVIIENMQIVYSLGLNEAGSYIKGLAERRFFWNRRLREKASRILKEWNVS